MGFASPRASRSPVQPSIRRMRIAILFGALILGLALTTLFQFGRPARVTSIPAAARDDTATRAASSRPLRQDGIDARSPQKFMATVERRNLDADVIPEVVRFQPPPRPEPGALPITAPTVHALEGRVTEYFK